MFKQGSFSLILSLLITSHVSAKVSGKLIDSSKSQFKAGELIAWINGVPGKKLNKKNIVKMDQKSKTFTPGILPIRKGDVVVFENRDNVFHNVFSLKKGAKFDLGVYKEKTKWSDDLSKKIESNVIPRKQFDKEGKIEVFCNIHQNMKGIIYVFNHPYFGKIGGDGAFSFPDLPDGEYKFFVDGKKMKKIFRKKVRVKDGKVDIPIDLSKYLMKGEASHKKKDGSAYGEGDLDEFY